MIQKNKIRMYLSFLIIIILAVVVFYGLLPFMNALFGGLILFALFKPLNDYWVVKKHWKPSRSAVTVIILSILIIIIPLSVLFSVVGAEVVDAIQNKAVLGYVTSLNDQFPQFSLLEKFNDQLPKVSAFLVNLVTNAFSQMGQVLINFIITYFIFYYLLITPKHVKRTYVHAIIPFSKKNSLILLDKFSAIVNSTLWTSGIIALVQAGLILGSFLFLGIEGAFFWGLVAFVLSFLPAAGVFLVWVPVDVALFVKGDYTGAIILLVVGIFMSTIDNILRPLLQQHSSAKMHPVTTLVGVFMGLSLFGIIGLIVGPLLLTFLLLTVQMFNEEYVK